MGNDIGVIILLVLLIVSAFLLVARKLAKTSGGKRMQKEKHSDNIVHILAPSVLGLCICAGGLCSTLYQVSLQGWYRTVPRPSAGLRRRLSPSGLSAPAAPASCGVCPAVDGPVDLKSLDKSIFDIYRTISEKIVHK